MGSTQHSLAIALVASGALAIAAVPAQAGFLGSLVGELTRPGTIVSDPTENEDVQREVEYQNRDAQAESDYGNRDAQAEMDYYDRFNR